ncbi:MAG: hypothetical protein CM15mP119_3190 [Alphaproteobacteria bacterium]|nr:MAG: hypothetical protein CM15mP119_3190 [Alphaproteobacteria bacterium]
MVAKDNDQRLVVNGDRVKHWLGLGAQPTERVQKLLSAVSLTDPVKLREQPKKSAPGKKRAEREAEAAEAAEAATAEALLRKLLLKRLLLGARKLLQKRLLLRKLLRRGSCEEAVEEAPAESCCRRGSC